MMCPFAILHHSASSSWAMSWIERWNRLVDLARERVAGVDIKYGGVEAADGSSMLLPPPVQSRKVLKKLLSSRA